MSILVRYLTFVRLNIDSHVGVCTRQRDLYIYFYIGTIIFRIFVAFANIASMYLQILRTFLLFDIIYQSIHIYVSIQLSVTQF